MAVEIEFADGKTDAVIGKDGGGPVQPRKAASSPAAKPGGGQGSLF
jgi:hypothetical protein